ncbi:hypothetical protein DMN91_001270 [Ooceraea biroi]|uniref:Uncharacterized protein n=1 Tax=Ooceraea biroi TaxID=2015173 RepID=A0A3L8E4B6_OOCBI|nr:hypothetical protein DMN91_001270 [Ooceraea biroi]
MPRPDVDGIAHTAHQSGHALNERQELRAVDNSRPFCASDEICDSMKCCHRDAALFEADNPRCSISSAGQAYAISHSAEPCCPIFNEQHQEYHVCEQEDYNAGTSGFNAEAQADWMPIGCIHAAYAHAKGCRCFCDSCGYYPSINMQLHRYHSIPMRVTGLLKNSDPSERLQREEIERFGSSCELRAASVAAEFATEADEYSRDSVARSGRCASCDEAEAARSSASTTRKCTASKASVFVEAGGSVDDLRDLRGANALPHEIEADPEESKRHTTTLAEKENDAWSHKSDSSRGGFVDTCATTTGDCIGRCCESPTPDRSPGVKGGFARGMDPKWVRDSIETDAQQLDYKWKRRIATIDDGARASVDFKGKRDSSSVQRSAAHFADTLRARFAQRSSWLFRRSQTRRDNINADGKRRDYSLWTSLQMGKIWSQVHDACRNVAKLAATSVSRLAKDAAKSECSRRNPEVEVADATHLVGSSSSHADGMCGEACRGNLMRWKTSEKSEAREEERAIDDAAGTYEDITISKQKKPRTPSERKAARKRAYGNPGKMENEKSCVFHGSTINNNQFSTRLPVAPTRSSKFVAYI